METFRQMVNDCIRIGLDNNVSTMKKLCNLTYKHFANYNIISYYKLCAISHAAGILVNREKSIKRGLQPRQPYAARPLLVSCYGFKVENGVLKVPLGGRHYFDIPLKIRSFTSTADTLSICILKEVREECVGTEGIDRNLHNLTIGDYNNVVQYDLSKAVDIA